MLGDFQEALCRLATDRGVRQRFFQSPQATLADFSLTEIERARLVSLAPQALERYADSLLAKRWDEVSLVIPLTVRAEPRLDGWYRRFLAASPAPVTPSCLGPGQAEALRALAPLQARMRDHETPAWVMDLLWFETLAAASAQDGVVRGGVSDFALHECVVQLRNGELPLDPDQQPHQYRFSRAPIRWRRVP